MQRAGRGLFNQAHALFPARNKDSATTKMRKQGATGLFHRFIVCQGASNEKAGFLGIANNYASSAISIQARGFWLYENRYAQLVTGAENAFGKIVGDEPFVVVREHERVKALQCDEQAAQEALFGFGSQRLAALAVHPHNLLMARDDARFHCGHAASVGKHAFFGNF